MLDLETIKGIVQVFWAIYEVPTLIALLKIKINQNETIFLKEKMNRR